MTPSPRPPKRNSAAGQRRFRRVRTPTVLQMEIAECGAACLGMVLAHYRRYVPLERLRAECGVTRDGVKASNIVRAARRYGLTAHGYRREPEELVFLKPPLILHWNFNHFVVWEGFHRGKAWINDPASGHRTVSTEELDRAFTGVVLTFEPGWRFREEGKSPGFLPALLRRFAAVPGALALLALLSLMLVVPGILAPSFARVFIDELVLAGRSDWLHPLLWAIAATALFQALITGLRHKLLLRMETKLALLDASSFFWHVLRLPLQFFQQRSPGDIVSRMNAVDTTAAFLSRNLAENLLNLVGVAFYLLVMCTYSLPLACIALGTSLVGVLCLVLTASRADERVRQLRQYHGKLYVAALTGLSGIETLKASGAESDLFVSWAGHHARLHGGQQRMAPLALTLNALPVLLTGVAEALVLCVGGLQIMDGTLTLGALIVFFGLMGGFMAPVSGLARLGMGIRRLAADSARVEDVMASPVDPLCKPDQGTSNQTERASRKLEGALLLRDVEFGYNLHQPPLLKKLNIQASPGMHVALVGASGSGKSTALRVIAGITAPWGGRVLYDGKHREDIPRPVLTASLSVVEQDAFLFQGTILDNLTMWDRTIPLENVWRAAEDACIHEEIRARAGGLNAEVEERGRNFSGGQRQRLEIARALVTDPSIFILDEATSALDTPTERRIIENIRRRGCTCVMAAHRVTAVRGCDEILVLSGGEVVQQGTHAQLLAVAGPYRDLVRESGG